MQPVAHHRPIHARRLTLSWFHLLALALVLALLAACGRGESTPEAPQAPPTVPLPTNTPAETNVAEADVADAPTRAPAPAGTPTPMNPDRTIITDSGVQYTEVSPGDGPQPALNDVVVIHYTATLEDGAVFENSYDRGEPARFVLGSGQVIPGWQEGIALMNEGGQAILVIPPELAYGEAGAREGRIPPNATIIVDVELLEVLPGAPEAPTEVDPDSYTTTQHGIQYVDLVEGDGPTPMPGQEVVVHYTGWLQEGGKFDSSRDRGEPRAFNLGMGQVIPGWDLGVGGMHVGGTRQLVVPPPLAYGEAGAGDGLIPPNATLIYEIELLEVR